VRYNISQNDRLRVMSTARNVTEDHNFQFYNNTIYLGEDLRAVVDSNDSPPGGEDLTPFTFTNNIFYRGAGRIARFFNPSFHDSPELPLHRGTWNGNVFYDLGVDDLPRHGARNRSEDPRFLRPGGAGKGLAGATAYQLQQSSPYLSDGDPVANAGGRDFFGTPLPGHAPTRGAAQASEETILSAGGGPRAP
jgi:hypothetical protein